MTWFIFALAAPALWGLVNHIDKYIISRYFTGKGVGSLVLFTSLTGFLAAILIAIMKPASLHLGTTSAIVIALSGALLVAAFIPYLHALENEETSSVTALWQLKPVLGYFLGVFFLGEHISNLQIFASSLVVLGAIFMSVDITKSIHFKAKPFLLMMLAAFMIAVNGLVFKMVAIGENFWGTAFWEYIGGTIFGLVLFVCIRLYREQFIATIEKSRSAVIGINIFAEALNIAAKLFYNFASLLAPLVLVWVVNGLQPLIIFIYGILITIFIPRWGKETLTKKVILQKISAIALMFVGVTLLFQ